MAPVQAMTPSLARLGQAKSSLSSAAAAVFRRRHADDKESSSSASATGSNSPKSTASSSSSSLSGQGVKPAPGAPPSTIPISLEAGGALAMKEVTDVMLKPRAHWVGDGFHVFPVFHHKAFTRAVSPFLMFDYAAPRQFDPARGRLGVGRHPHRGMETVTIAWQGEVEHGDHLGNRDVIKSGDVQWMTAGRGIVHEEYHSRAFAATGGTFEMCQLWVNLPAAHKMDPARYQPIAGGSIPSVDLADGKGRIRVIAGEYAGRRGPAMTFSPIDMWEVLLNRKGDDADLVLPGGHNTIIFVKRGSALVGAQGSELHEQDVALMGELGRQVPVRALEDRTEILVLSGEPFNEPIAARGPFVMNSPQELYQAFEDYHNGENGFGSGSGSFK